MKKMIIVLLSAFIFAASVASTDSYWKYVMHNKLGCIKTDDIGLEVTDLMEAGCTTYDRDNTRDEILIMNCRNHPAIRGFVFFGMTKSACESLKK